jgi:hypothetical protein
MITFQEERQKTVLMVLEMIIDTIHGTAKDLATGTKDAVLADIIGAAL